MRTRNREFLQRGSANWWLLVVVLLLAIAGWVMWWRGHGGATTACAVGDLSLSATHPEGTAGTMYVHATLTNNSSHKCSLAGYPTAFLLDSHNTVLGLGAAPNTLYSPVSVMLAASGGQAHAVLGFPDFGNFQPGTCDTASTSLQVYPPGSASALTMPYVQHSCPGFSVTAVQAGP